MSECSNQDEDAPSEVSKSASCKKKVANAAERPFSLAEYVLPIDYSFIFRIQCTCDL